MLPDEAAVTSEGSILLAKTSFAMVMPPRASTRIYISGKCRVSYCELNTGCYVVGLSTHADFNGLLWYIEKSKAKSVAVDRARHPGASLFSHLIEKKLGINRVVTPR